MTEHRPTDPRAAQSHHSTVRGINRLLMPMTIALPLWVLSVVYVGYAFVSASTAARQAAGDATFRRSLLSLPILEGFRNADRFGVHVLWGVPALFVAPLVIATVLTAIGLARRRNA